MYVFDSHLPVELKKTCVFFEENEKFPARGMVVSALSREFIEDESKNLQVREARLDRETPSWGVGRGRDEERKEEERKKSEE